MGLKICDNRIVKHPYRIEELDACLYSLEELAYVIYEHPLLVMDDFLCDRLYEFLRIELDYGGLTLQLEKLKSENKPDDELLIYILEYSELYSAGEVTKYKTKLANYRKLHNAELLKAKADYMFGLKKYGKAIRLYGMILKMPDDHVVNDSFKGIICNNMGSAYANLFLLGKAYKAYDRAYGYTKSQDVLKQIYYLSLLEPVLELKDRYQSIVRDNIKSEWDVEYTQVEREAETGADREQLDAMWDKDPIRRMNIAKDLLNTWKQEYRNMI